MRQSPRQPLAAHIVESRGQVADEPAARADRGAARSAAQTVEYM